MAIYLRRAVNPSLGRAAGKTCTGLHAILMGETFTYAQTCTKLTETEARYKTRFACSPDSHPAPGRGQPPRPTRCGGAERFPKRSPSRDVSPDLQSGIFALQRAFSA